MHYNGPIIRPQTDAFNSIFLEVTVGCTHDGCKFCNFYDGYPFRMAPMEQIEADLQEVAQYAPGSNKIWASGGNPFALSVDKLAEIARLIHRYVPEARISTYAHINDFKQKSMEEIRYLKDLGYVDIVVGIESGDDAVLSHMNKGYTQADIVREFTKLEAAGASYRVIYLGGLAGKDRCEESALRTANLLNQFHPRMMILTTVAILPGTELYREVQEGIFLEPSELERIKEFRTLVASLKNPLIVFAETSTDMVSFTAYLPEDQASIVSQLDDVITNFTAEDELYFHRIRSRMTSV
ncbi:MAG TPA: radical SAM protein [Clostridiaceae bacterium]|nr:radical SAM protein [Clostridiaceae bacterium]